jgi:ring-1,2-phenylacetyl-CoA epoxidase subunit PaaC
MASLSPAFKKAVEPLLLSLADDELVIGHRHSEWTGWAPHIEEDIAFSSIAQDEIGHANLFFGMLAEVTETSVDELALGRKASEYTNALICERHNEDWAYTLARHFLYDSAERIRLTSFARSSYKPLAEVCEKLLREERYHQLHADAWFQRLSRGPVEGRHEFAMQLGKTVPDAVGLFEGTSWEPGAVENGIMPESFEELLQRWLDDVVGRIEDAGLPLEWDPDDDAEFVPTSAGEMIEQPHNKPARPPSITRQNDRFLLEGDFPGMGGRLGHHSEAFEDLWDDLTKTYREEPTATW